MWAAHHPGCAARLYFDDSVGPVPRNASRGSVQSDSRRGLLEVIRLFLKLGAISFGGPAAHVALMEQEALRRRGLRQREAVTATAKEAVLRRTGRVILRHRLTPVTDNSPG